MRGTSAGWGGPGAQLVGVVGILAVIRAQVVAEAECGPFVTFAGLPLASRSTSWRGMEMGQSLG